MSTASGKMVSVISATGVTDSCEMSGPFSVYLPGPEGSTIKLEYSPDNENFDDFVISGSSLAYSSAVCDVVNNRGNMWFRWNCTTYGGTPFGVIMAGH